MPDKLSLEPTESTARYTTLEIPGVPSSSSYEEDCQGFCVWLTGYSGSGKSTIAECLERRLHRLGRVLTLLDGDIVRAHLSKGLGFSKEDRDTNVCRIGFVASEIVRHRGAVICAAISPYQQSRDEVRSMVGSQHFILVHVDTPVEVCEERDTKGLYAKARKGEIKGFTGVDDPYEVPVAPEISLKTVGRSAEECSEQIIDFLLGIGHLKTPDGLHEPGPVEITNSGLVG